MYLYSGNTKISQASDSTALGYIVGDLLQTMSAWSHMGNERIPGYFLYIGDYILPIYIMIIIKHYKDPY